MVSANPQDAPSVQNPEVLEKEHPASFRPSEGLAAPSLPLEPSVWIAPVPLRHRPPPAPRLGLTLVWLYFSVSVIGGSVGWEELAQLLPHELGGLFAGVATPIALLWMVIAF